MQTESVVLGIKLPVIAELEGGYLLVAHQNGPAIALPEATGQGGSLMSLCANWNDVPERVQETARRKFEEIAWPLVKPKFYPQ